MSFVNRGRAILAATLVALGLGAHAVTNSVTHRTLPDPQMPRRKKSSGGKGGRGSHLFAIRPRPRHTVKQAPYIAAPAPQNKSRPKPNKLQLIEMVLRNTADGSPYTDADCGRYAQAVGLKFNTVLEAKDRALEIAVRRFAPRLALQREKIYALGGDPDAGDMLEFDATNDFDGVRLVRAARPVDRIPLHMHALGG